ncbi:uncharacterized protein KY384_001883 [Bacidia gigantensis]|uniref:uncharacterized protein n=1 Tax=Bacidia gigantensis TaxID=2732470 RepID=UPI001D045519|nr:uncharacterized protein KY384_001883 [Bacidia gigantensis]KAG8533100.1 hypothetical protein KY384_001883 [Bacidia gigantensis]
MPGATTTDELQTNGPDCQLHPTSSRQGEWIRLEEEKRHDFLDLACDESLQVNTLEDLQKSLHELVDEFKLRNSFVERLNPTFDHLTSFTQAITSASQYNPVACLVWGGIQAVVLDLYVDYVGFCVTAAQYFKRGPAVNFLTNFFSGKSHFNIKQSKANIRRHVKTFKRAAELAHRERVRRQHLEVQKKLGDNFVELPSQFAPSSSDMSKITFPVSTVGMNRNWTFTGRDEDLIKVHDVLIERRPSGTKSGDSIQPDKSGNDSGPACCVLTGIGGVGKTQTALEYTYRYRDKYDAIFWLEAEDKWTLTAKYAQISDALGLLDQHTFEKDGHRRQTLGIEKAREWLQSTGVINALKEKRWLLVFDNAEDINDVDPYLPLESNSRGSILITTQRPINFGVTKIFATVEMKSFNRDHAAALLFKYLQRDAADEKEEEMARKLSDTVDGLPLAIATIGGYINQSQSNLVEYTQTLQHSSNAWTASAIGPVSQYEKNLETVFDIAIAELSDKAREVLTILAFLNPDNIPEALFDAAVGKDSLKFVHNKADLLEIIRELRKRQLIRREASVSEPYIATHRTVQWNVLLFLSKDYTHRWEVFQQAFRLVKNVLPDDSPFVVPSPDKWPKFQKYGPHILSLRSHCLWPDPPIELPVNFAEVLSDMGTFMWHAGKVPEGEEALETASDVMDENKVEDDNTVRADVYNLLGIITSFDGVSERERSMDLRHKAYNARKAEFGGLPQSKVTIDDEIKREIVNSDFAYALVQEEDFDQAAEIFSKTLQKYHEWGPEDEYPYQYSQYHQVVAVCLMAAQKPVESIEHITHCTDLLVKSSDTMHPMTQLMRFIAGFLTWHAGEREKALEINESVLEGRRKIIGDFSHFTLESYSTTAKLLAETGNLEKARVYLDCCLERRKRNAWNEEGVARAQFRYAHVLEQLGEKTEAAKQRELSRKTMLRFMERYPRYLPQTPDDEESVLDQMVSIWAGRFTGKMVQKEPGFVHTAPVPEGVQGL